jgi:ZIP family zinc transporter
MESAAVDNDTRGWILAAVSGAACVVGASVIFVDLVVRQFPGKRDFRIQDSNLFLAGSLSMSFGVMLFSALYSMLPSAKPYLVKAGYSESAASVIVMTAFVGGFFGIQAISRVLHQFMPSHVVDCDHSHDQSAVEEQRADGSRHVHRREGHRGDGRSHGGHKHSHGRGGFGDSNGDHGHGHDHDHDHRHHHNHHDSSEPHSAPDENTPLVARPPSQKPSSSDLSTSKIAPGLPRPARTWTGGSRPAGVVTVKAAETTTATPADGGGDLEAQMPRGGTRLRSGPDVHDHHHHPSASCSSDSTPETLVTRDDNTNDECDAASVASSSSAHPFNHHHHHVPTNAFMAIGLQTSIAITLHKFPEGFITYATNHANPALGFSVFMALFVHNISEGFALALPLYMALGSRARALAWASALGGLSQPLGAAIAALWFRVAAGRSVAPGAVFYAVLFAVTAGIMVGVALQLFAESMSLCHSRNLCIFWGFLGMAVLGFSGALVGGHAH